MAIMAISGEVTVIKIIRTISTDDRIIQYHMCHQCISESFLIVFTMSV